MNSAVAVGEAVAAVFSWLFPVHSLCRDASEHEAVKLSLA